MRTLILEQNSSSLRRWVTKTVLRFDTPTPHSLRTTTPGQAEGRNDLYSPNLITNLALFHRGTSLEFSLRQQHEDEGGNWRTCLAYFQIQLGWGGGGRRKDLVKRRNHRMRVRIELGGRREDGIKQFLLRLNAVWGNRYGEFSFDLAIGMIE